MRIAWVLYGGLEQRTGGTIYDAEVVRGLREAGDEVHVVSLVAGDHAATAEALVKEVASLAPDVVVGDELCFRELAVAFPRVGSSLRVLLVHHLTAWETELDAATRGALRQEEQRALAECNAVIVTSRATRERLVAEGVTGEIDVVLPGADRLRGRGRGRGRGRDVRFVFVGSVVARKAVLPLVRAFAKGASANGSLVLVGSTTRDPAYFAEVRRAIDEAGLSERVRIVGELDEEGVAEAIEHADVLVMPSTLEGYGIAATEAVRAGLPVIAARAQGLEEALAPCPDACLFADDEDALADALGRFANDQALRAAMTAAARAASSMMPTWSGCAAAFRACLVQALARRS